VQTRLRRILCLVSTSVDIRSGVDVTVSCLRCMSNIQTNSHATMRFFCNLHSRFIHHFGIQYFGDIKAGEIRQICHLDGYAPGPAIATEAIVEVKDKLSATNRNPSFDVTAYYTLSRGPLNPSPGLWWTYPALQILPTATSCLCVLILERGLVKTGWEAKPVNLQMLFTACALSWDEKSSGS
jgi:hypothetical protein